MLSSRGDDYIQIIVPNRNVDSEKLPYVLFVYYPAMVGVASGSLQADSQPRSFGLV